ncbi:MAG TPA: DUF1592 domain-containing protein [Phenylobacterium sp.]|nr:DUF1592 domain-containing protein [Phenylobacterium sp.]
MRRTTTALFAAAAMACLAGVGVAAHQARADSSAAPVAGQFKAATRRITESQYRHAIRDAFGPDLRLEGRFEPEKREGGLLAVGRAPLSVTASGLEQYYALGQSVADQALAPKRRATIMPCQPADPKKADAACARQFVELYGEQLFRRPLTESEVAARLHAAQVGADQSGDFYEGLKLALTSLLIAPDFLFRIEAAEPDPAKPGQYRLDGYTKASRLSFLFWDAAPDAELLAAAKSGDIHTTEGLNRQLARLSASPRLQEGARAFFTDMLQMDQFEGLTKDTKAYPKFSQEVADSAKEQTLRTVVDMLVVKQRDYRDLFTSNETFINRELAAVYQVPFRSTERWAPYTFAPSSERSGVLTQVAFLSLFAHPAASSPTRRGVKVHEIFACQPTPEPPPNVDFSKVQALTNGTVRTRLMSHMENAGCSSCHKASDPLGLALEHFDGLGQLRTLENGQTIDVSATIDGRSFSGAQGLGRALHDDPKIPACLVRNAYAYGVGRGADERDDAYLTNQSKAFAADGYRFPAMLVRVASSPEFFKVKIPSGYRPATRVAAATAAPAGDAR